MTRTRLTILAFGILAVVAWPSQSFGQTPCSTEDRKCQREEQRRANAEAKQQSGQNEPGRSADRQREKKEKQ